MMMMRELDGVVMMMMIMRERLVGVVLIVMIDSRDVSDDRDDSDDSDDDDERELGWCSDDDGTLGLNSCYIHLCLTPPPSPASPAAQHYLPQLAAQLYTATT